jgi:hypothetical protein
MGRRALTLTNNGTAGNKGIVNISSIRGDRFAVNIDYTISNFPTPSDKGTRSEIFLAVLIGDRQYRLAYITAKAGQCFSYQAWPGNPIDMPAKYATSGRLRLKRNGSRLVGEAWRDGAWAMIGSIDIPADLPAYAVLGTFSDTGHRLSVRFGTPRITVSP